MAAIQPVLPCIACENKSARCSTHCKILHQFLRWEDGNKAGVRSQAREVHVSTEFLDVIDQQRPDLPNWQDIASAGIEYGMLDLSWLPDNDRKLFEDRYIKDISIADLAHKYNLKPAGIKSRIKRIRRKVKENCYLILLKKAYPDTIFPE